MKLVNEILYPKGIEEIRETQLKQIQSSRKFRTFKPYLMKDSK